MPTLDGHCCDETIYTTKEEQAKKILEYIKTKGIKDIALLQGSSMGAQVALEMVNQSDICIKNVFLAKKNLLICQKEVLMKKYPNSIFRDMEGFKHLGYQTRQPMEYAKILKDTIG